MSFDGRNPSDWPPLQQRIQQRVAVGIGPIKAALGDPEDFGQYLDADFFDAPSRQRLERSIDPFFTLSGRSSIISSSIVTTFSGWLSHR
jgi:hypothetical protein